MVSVVVNFFNWTFAGYGNGQNYETTEKHRLLPKGMVWHDLAPV